MADETTTASDPHIYAYALAVNTGIPITPGLSFQTLAAPFGFPRFRKNGNFVYALEASAGADALIEGFTLNSTTGSVGFGRHLQRSTNGWRRADLDQERGSTYSVRDSMLIGTTLTVNVGESQHGSLGTWRRSHGSSPTFPLAVTD